MRLRLCCLVHRSTTYCESARHSNGPDGGHLRRNARLCISLMKSSHLRTKGSVELRIIDYNTLAFAGTFRRPFWHKQHIPSKSYLILYIYFFVYHSHFGRDLIHTFASSRSAVYMRIATY